MNKLLNRLRTYFRDKETRHYYIDEFLNEYLATQIKVLREQRGWSQEELAERANLSISHVDALEDVNHWSWDIEVLRTLAEAFDVPLKVSFATFGDMLKEIEVFGRRSLERVPFEEDTVFMEQEKEPFTPMPISVENLVAEEDWDYIADAKATSVPVSIFVSKSAAEVFGLGVYSRYPSIREMPAEQWRHARPEGALRMYQPIQYELPKAYPHMDLHRTRQQDPVRS